MNKGRMIFTFIMILVIALFTFIAPAEIPDNENVYTFKDRYGTEYRTGADAFATEVVSFIPGSPWTGRTEYHDTQKTLGLPDYDETNDIGDLNLGASGEIVLKLDVYVIDGPGNDLCVFEDGPNVESTRVALSNDMRTWYDVGVSPGSTAGVDITGKVPAGAAFRYVRITDLRDYPGGTQPGADIDALCALNYINEYQETETNPAAGTPAEQKKYVPGDPYAFTDRNGNQQQTDTNAFATEVVSFVSGYPEAVYPENKDPQVTLGIPDLVNGNPTSTGDLSLGGGGVLVLGMDVFIFDGPGDDLCIFEAGDAQEVSRIELSNDLKTWYTVAVSPGGTDAIDLAGRIPLNESFRYVRIVDLKSGAKGNWPGADIDAVCALNFVTELLPEEQAEAPENFTSSGEPYSAKDVSGNLLETTTDAFATKVICFVPGYPWARNEVNRDPMSTLGIPESKTDSLTIGASGEIIVQLDAYVFDGPGNDLAIFEDGTARESLRIELSNDLKTWYFVGITNAGVESIDIAGKIPDGMSFRYVKLVDLRDQTDGKWPGADVLGICALNYRKEYIVPNPSEEPGTVEMTETEATAPQIEGEPYLFKDRYGVEYQTYPYAFATEVISYVPGSPWTKRTEYQDPQRTLGIPAEGIETNLGASGEIVLKLDVLICDGPGNDLCVFEVGPDVESTRIALSDDLLTWYDVGVSPGSTAGVDIEGKVPEGASFRYVRITDLRDYPGSTWPGADINALCALNFLVP